MAYLSLLISCSMWITVSIANICQPGYSSHGMSCFKMYTITKTWADAEASCVADGGHLASIHSSEEQNFIKTLASDNTWIGLSGVRPNLVWSDNSDEDYENWCSGEPNASGMQCGRMKSSCSYEWSDVPCSRTYHYVCRTGGESVMLTTQPGSTSTGTTLAVTTGTGGLDLGFMAWPATTFTEMSLTATTGKDQICFTKLPSGVNVDVRISPSQHMVVTSELQCARRCKQDAQCAHFIMSEDGGKYLCETYTSLYRPPTATPPTGNYQKINCY